MTDLLGIAKQAFAPDAPRRIGVAVSGGSDSMATLVLLARHFEVAAVTVDHGLRPEASAEAEQVAAFCAARGWRHTTLCWHRPEAPGNLMDQARRARFALIGDWAQQAGIGHVALGHTVNDQAETFLMRLAREAGLEGLSGMRPRFEAGGVIWHRPFLGVTRADLRDVLRERGIPWSDDPSNENPACERVRARRALAGLNDLGITAQGLGQVSAHLAAARAALDAVLAAFLRDHVAQRAGDLWIDLSGFGGLAFELRRRLLEMALIWVSGADYGPRAAKLAGFLERCETCSLHGCLITVAGGRIHIGREPAAVARLRVPADRIWDGWQLDGPSEAGLEIAALGPAGLRSCPDWRAAGLPQNSLRASPAIWRGDQLVAAPLAGVENGWKTRKAAGEFAISAFRR